MKLEEVPLLASRMSQLRQLHCSQLSKAVTGEGIVQTSRGSHEYSAHCSQRSIAVKPGKIHEKDQRQSSARPEPHHCLERNGSL